MVLPGGKIIRAIHGYASAFRLVLDLVFTKPPELAGLLVDRDPSSVGVDQAPIRIVPPTTRDNVLCAGEAGEQQRGKYPRSEHICKLGERRRTGHIRSPEFLPITATRKIGRLYEKITVGMAKTHGWIYPELCPACDRLLRIFADSWRR